MSDFPSIPEHIKDNYRERVAAGEKWLAIHEQAVKDDVHDIAAWAAHEAELVQEVAAKVTKATKPRKTTETRPAPEPVVEPAPHVEPEVPAEVVEPAPVVETPAP